MGTLPPLLPDQSGQKMLGGELGEVTGQKAWRLGIEMKGAGTGEFPIPGRPTPSRLSHILGILDLNGDEGGPAVRACTAHEEVEGRIVAEIARITPSGRVLEGQLLHLREETGEEALEEAMAAFLIHLAQCEQVEGERLARQEILPQALLIDEGAVFSIGYGTARQPSYVRGKEITTTTRIGGIQATAQDAEAPIPPSMPAGSKSTPCTPQRLQMSRTARKSSIPRLKHVMLLENIPWYKGETYIAVSVVIFSHFVTRTLIGDEASRASATI